MLIAALSEKVAMAGQLTEYKDQLADCMNKLADCRGQLANYKNEPAYCDTFLDTWNVVLAYQEDLAIWVGFVTCQE